MNSDGQFRTFENVIKYPQIGTLVYVCCVSTHIHMDGCEPFSADTNTIKKHFQNREEKEPRINVIHPFSIQVENPPNLSSRNLHCAKSSLNNKIFQPLCITLSQAIAKVHLERPLTLLMA